MCSCRNIQRQPHCVGLFSSEGVEDGGGADGKADYGAQGRDEHGVGAPVEDVGSDGREGEGYAYDVEPERCAH